MTTKNALIYSVTIHTLILVIIIMITIEQKKEIVESPIILEYTFIDKPKDTQAEKAPDQHADKIKKISLPPVELPRENPPEITSADIIQDTSFNTTPSLVIMRQDSLTAIDSLLLTDPNLLAFRTVFMERVINDTPEDTSKRWKQIAPVSMAEYLQRLKYSDGFNNAQMQKEYNTGGIKIPLDAIFDLFK